MSTTSNRARVPTPKQLSSVGVKKDEFETFWHILTTYCQQDADYLEFFEGGTYSNWQALSANPTRGIKVQPDTDSPSASEIREANSMSALKRANLNSLLTTIAAYCPEGLFKTILVDSTSINWIKRRVIKVCNIESNGRHLPKALNISYNKGEESPAAFYEKVRSTFIDSLMPAGSMFHGVPLVAQETLTPTFESVIVILCLKAIHPDLPDFIMNNKGMLFTTATPNFCDIKEELWETMDTLLTQMEAQENIQRLHTSNKEENLRWVNFQRKQSGKNIQSFKNGSSLGTRSKYFKQSCDYCKALGKDEKIWTTHDKFNCFSLFPEKKKNRTQARMLSVPVLTDENESWDLQQAIEAVTDQYNASQIDVEACSSGDELSPQ